MGNFTYFTECGEKNKTELGSTFPKVPIENLCALLDSRCWGSKSYIGFALIIFVGLWVSRHRLNTHTGTSLVVQWLRLRTPRWGAPV